MSVLGLCGSWDFFSEVGSRKTPGSRNSEFGTVLKNKKKSKKIENFKNFKKKSKKIENLQKNWKKLKKI